MRFRILSTIVLLGATVIRLDSLDTSPLHHDEGVNGFFLLRLFREDIYRYNPENYHGPSLYYFGLASVYLFGVNSFAIRFVPAVFGIATVWLVLKLKESLGESGALTAAALIAVSPGAVYMSRYFIHETLFVFFTAGLVSAGLIYHKKRSVRYAMLIAVLAALLFATKETAIINGTVLAIATALAALYTAVRRKDCGENETSSESSWLARAAGALRGASGRRLGTVWFPALGLFGLVAGVMYSSLLSNPKGARDALQTLEFWVRTGRTEHVHPWNQYIVWLGQEESPLLALGITGAALALWRARDRFSVMAALWATGSIAAYSLLSYKTPWLALNFIIPLGIIAGHGIGTIYEGSKGRLRRGLVIGLAVSAAAILACRSISLSFFHYDDDRYAYVYAHTRREFLSLVQEIDRLAGQTGKSRDTSIAVMSPDYWPLPWYLRNYPTVGYYGKVVGSSDDIVVGSEAQVPELDSLLGDRYSRAGSYILRPGVNLVLYARREMLD